MAETKTDKSAAEFVPIYVRRELHGKLKSYAALKGKKLRDVCEDRLRPLIMPNGKASR